MGEMKLTNRFNLPQPIYDAVKNDGYSKGDADISVTELLAPARQVALKHEHLDEIEEDCSERIWSLVGQVMHGILERANANAVAERRLSIQVEGWKVSGGMDLYHPNGLLQDYKFVTAYKFKDKSAPVEYEQQLNVYAEILRQNGHPVSKLEIVGILRDWSKMEAARDPSYPQSQVVIVSIPLWPEALIKKFIRERVLIHQMARKILPHCTPEERWQKPDVYAVMKKDGKRAVKLYDSEKEAMKHAAESPDLTVVKRPGISTRCLHYCSVAKFCRAKDFNMGDDAA